MLRQVRDIALALLDRGGVPQRRDIRHREIATAYIAAPDAKRDVDPTRRAHRRRPAANIRSAPQARPSCEKRRAPQAEMAAAVVEKRAGALLASFHHSRGGRPIAFTGSTSRPSRCNDLTTKDRAASSCFRSG